MGYRIFGAGAAVAIVAATAMLMALGDAPFPASALGGGARLFSGARLCTRGQLALSLELAPPAMGHAYVRYVLRNRGGSTCSVAGTPRLTILHASRRLAPATLVHSLRMQSVRSVTVAPRHIASFIVDARACAFDPSINPAAPTITQITLPGQSKPFSFTSPATTQCARQELAVSPLSPGQASPPAIGGQ